MSGYISIDNSVSFYGNQQPLMIINLTEFTHSYADYWLEGAWDEAHESDRRKVVYETRNRLESFIGGCTDELDGKFMFLWPLLKKPVQDVLLYLYNDAMFYPTKHEEEFNDLPLNYQEDIREKKNKIMKAMEDRDTFYQLVLDTLDTYLYHASPCVFEAGTLRECVRHAMGMDEYQFDFLDYR